MYLNPNDMSQRDRYKFTIGAVLPRPIAWVSSRDLEGNLNLAPYSFFTVASTNPLVLMFCPQAPAPAAEKDTLRNVEAVGEFVVNIVNEATAEAMNQTATGLPPNESEFAFANLTPAASQTISVPRVAEAPIAFECTLHQVVKISGADAGGGAVVFGRVLNIFIKDGIYDTEKKYVRLDKLQPIGRLAGNQYAHINDIFELIRQ